MKRSYENQQTKHGLRRVIAILLALSLILIPVHFPSAANAAGETITGEFTDPWGQGYTWNLNNYASKTNYAEVKEEQGKLVFSNISTKKHVFAYIASAGEGSADMTDYTLTVTFTREPNDGQTVNTPTYANIYFRLRLKGGNNGYTGYCLSITNGNYDGTGDGTAIVRKLDGHDNGLGDTLVSSFSIMNPAKGSCTISLKLEGNTYTLSYTNKDGESDTKTFTDEAAVGDSPYLSGTVAVGCGSKEGTIKYESVNVHIHKWATEWTSDGIDHWHKCTVTGCNEVNEKAGHTPEADDGDCTTPIKCSVCQTVTAEAKENHTPEADDGDCTTAVKCSVCQKVTTEAKENHTPEADDGDCTTAIKCSVCQKVTTEAKENHTPEADDGDCATEVKCSVCQKVTTEAQENHTPEADDGDCTTPIKCSVCHKVTTEAKENHTPEADDGDCTTAVKCTVCQKVTTAATDGHKGGTATCEDKAKCSVCGKEYGELAAHTGGEATCTDKAKCELCGEGYGEKNADKHTKEAKWTTTADKHSKAYECCNKVVVAEEAHSWKDGKCEECGYEVAPGTEQKPIEIPADKETVKAEAKVEAGSEQHYELDEKMAGKTITIKGEGAYAIIEGTKYEAVDGVLEVKLPAKTGKIPVIIGNAGTKAGTFSITIATPAEDNSDTGDSAAIVLFGSLMVLSMLATGALLVPDVSKKLLGK